MKKNIQFFSIFALFCFCGCSGRIKDGAQDKKERFLRKSAIFVQSSIEKENREKYAAFEKFVESVPLKDKVCQLFIENLEGDKVFVPVEKDFVPGGYIFFSYNLANSAREIMNFTDSVKNYCAEKNIIPPFLAVDQEGGFVNRLKIVNGPLPSAEKVSSVSDVSAAYKLYSLQAKQMKALGFDMNLAPVVEVKSKENEKFLDDRSFGSFEQVRTFGTACVNAYENNGVAAVIKHFPGNTNTDPHTGLPEIDLPESRLHELLAPFGEIARVFPAGVLMSHARIKAVDEEIPACFSRRWVSEILCGKLGFNGIVFSDDIFMGALSKNGFLPEETAVKAIEAGVNVIMVSEKRISGPAKVLIKKAEESEEFKKLIEKSFKKVMEYKIKFGIVDFEKNSAGNYEIKFAPEKKSLNERMKIFNDARKENIELYIDYFD